MSDLTGFLGPAYLWVKAAHVTFVIFWLAGLFLLPRFYVYHHETAVGSPEDRAWIERESRVRSIILNPAMIVVWILGLMLAFNVDAWSQHWAADDDWRPASRCSGADGRFCCWVALVTLVLVSLDWLRRLLHL